MTPDKQSLSRKDLEIDLASEVEQIATALKNILISRIRRRGLVVAISGGIDSSVSATLSVAAVGQKRVFGLLLPEQDSSGSSTERGEMLARHLGIDFEIVDIAPTLDAIGCYRERDEAIRTIFPEYGTGWANKIVIEGGLQGRVNHFKLVVKTPDGKLLESRLPLKQYLAIVAATNYKQRIRKTIEYFHADRLNYAVVGTPNRLEYDQGFFVKNGDGSADVKPIAHLYKSQVYSLAKFLELPEEICNAVPTTDTYSLPQGQDEFYFALPYKDMDLALYAYNNGNDAAELARVLGIDQASAEFVFQDIANKRATTAYLHAPGILVGDVPEISRK